LQLDEFDDKFAGDLKEFIGNLELLMSEANHKSLGGPRTIDQAFAYSVYEQLRVLLPFLDRVGDLVDEILMNASNEINEADLRNDDLQEKLNHIMRFIEDYQRLDQIKKIIKGYE
jgi:hypothetical protein